MKPIVQLKEPESRQEYEQRYNDNLRVEGHYEQTATVFPCPFCAAPDFMVGKVVDFEYREWEKEHVCSACGRGAKFTVARSPGQLLIEMIQTRGKEAPPWVPMPREQ